MKLEIFIKEIEGERYLCLRLADLTLLKPKRKTFEPPTLEQVKVYCKERKNQVNINQWMAHYESNGWMVGKNKMKSWKSAVHTWEMNSFKADVVISNGSNLGDPPPEYFGIRSESAVTREQYLANKKQT